MLYVIILIFNFYTACSGQDSINDICICHNDLIRKYETEANESTYVYKTCIIKHVKQVTPGIFISDNTLFTYGCQERVVEVCCRGPGGDIDKCEHALAQQEEDTKCFLKLGKKRRVFDMIWNQDILSAKECAAFGTTHGGTAANVTADTYGYKVLCGCGRELQNCEQGDMLVCDNYVAGMILLKGTVTKLALFQSKYLNSSDNKSVTDNDTMEFAALDFVNGCNNLKLMNYAIIHVIIMLVFLAVQKRK